ncbi:MAG: acyl carrier protein [Christensenellales bacterium]|jgi:acyl carrier protein|nr:acyl carrier protein [Clostridia bacterium]HRU84752.1 acyl carrier protein [Eubacteriales bacterium]
MVFEKLRKIISEQFGISEDKVTLASDLVKEIGADSLDVVEMLISIEAAWNIAVEDDAVRGMKTVGDVVKYIEANVK